MKITKYNIIAAFLLVSSSVMSQITEIDGLKFVQTDINGTARYMSMAGELSGLWEVMCLASKTTRQLWVSTAVRKLRQL